MRRLASGLLLALAVALSILAPSTASATQCYQDWRSCRLDAQGAYDRGEVGVVRYSLMLDLCDFGYGTCNLKA